MHTPIGCLVFQSVHDWLKNTKPAGDWLTGWVDCTHTAEGSGLDILGDNAEDHVLVASPHHHFQRFVPLYDSADITGRGDWLAVDADDDVFLLQASTVTKKESKG